MKLVMLMYLEEDEECVQRLMEDHEVPIFSRLPLEGVGPGTRGWYGEAAPYRSRMAMSVLEDDRAEELAEAVRGCTGVKDPRHPVRAVVVDVEKTVECQV